MNNEYKSLYNENGFLKIRNFFSKKDISNIPDDAEGIFLRQLYSKHILKPTNNHEEEEFNRAVFLLFKKDIQCFINCGKQAQHLISLHKLSMKKKLVKLLMDIGITSPNNIYSASDVF